MKEIAVDVGLENYAYFSRLFKKRTGLTPSQYRKVASKNLSMTHNVIERFLFLCPNSIFYSKLPNLVD